MFVLLCVIVGSLVGSLFGRCVCLCCVMVGWLVVSLLARFECLFVFIVGLLVCSMFVLFGLCSCLPVVLSVGWLGGRMYVRLMVVFV